MSNKFSITVNGIEIKNDAIYKIVPKLDHDAPQAFQDLGTTKLLVEGVGEGAPCLFDESQGVWDTGFFKESPCYRGVRTADVEVYVASRVKHIKEPFEALRGKKVLDHVEDNTFWDSFAGSNLYNGRTLYTKNAKDLLELYIAALHGYICTKETQNDPTNRNASYLVVNRDKDVSINEERKLQKGQALKEYFKLETVDPTKAKEVLSYIGLPSADGSATTSILMDYVDHPKQGYKNAEFLVTVLKKANSDSGYKEINTFTQLADLFKRNSITKEGGSYIFKSIDLGMDLKAASMKVSRDKELRDMIKNEILALEG